MTGPKSVHIIEDDAVIRDSLKELLEFESYTVHLAEHGQEALSILQRLPGRPAFILLDLHMPVMDGESFLRVVTTQFPVIRNIPILIMTAATPSDFPTGIDHAMIIRKPIDLDELFDKINRAMKA